MRTSRVGRVRQRDVTGAQVKGIVGWRGIILPLANEKEILMFSRLTGVMDLQADLMQSKADELTRDVGDVRNVGVSYMYILYVGVPLSCQEGPVMTVLKNER